MLEGRMRNRLPAALLFTILALGGCATKDLAPDTELVRVHETSDLADARDSALALAREEGQDRILVAIDLDNTLLAMRSGLGSDQWYDWQKRLQTDNPCDPRLVSDRLAVQGALYHAGAMRLTQDDAGEIVASLQRAGIPTMILTARGKEFRLPTFRELRRHDLDFRDSAPGPRGGFEQPYVPEGGTRPVRFEDGVYMLAGQHKGRMLLELFERLGMEPPEVVVFVDDKAKNVAAVREALEAAAIRGELFHYRGEAERVARFDSAAAVRAWEEAAPALRTLERLLGSWNYDLPEPAGRPAGCP